jgi:LPPG:FO 2-phospho-L-lactate transferase
MYTLADWIDEAKGWGVRDETFHCRTTIERLGGPTYFALGDRDLAVHLLRSEQLRAGVSLSEVTRRLCERLGVRSRLLPMSNDRVRTRVRTPDGWLAFQEFFVRDRCAPDVLDVDYDGCQRARPAPGVIEAIHEADAIIVCPSNPISSVGPILSVPGVRAALVETRARVAAVSPLVGTTAVSGPAAKMMHAKGLDVSPLGVADAYAGFLDVLLIDRDDAALASQLDVREIRTIATDILMTDRDREATLARAALEALA